MNLRGQLIWISRGANRLLHTAGALEFSSRHRMTHVVTDNCINCKHTDCVEVCPVDCFHAGPNFLVIDPDECIDCT